MIFFVFRISIHVITFTKHLLVHQLVQKNQILPMEKERAAIVELFLKGKTQSEIMKLLKIPELVGS